MLTDLEAWEGSFKGLDGRYRNKRRVWNTFGIIYETLRQMQKSMERE